ncbi:MAG: phage minor head protein [Pseudomonadota bacterium]
MTSQVSVSNTTPQEAIDHFTNKLPLPTTRWDQVVGDIRAKAFTVAGATKMGILHDLQAGIERAISEGTTLAEFQETFDQVVEEVGWSYKGSRQWRTALIFNNNVRSSYLAGRWQQYQRAKATRPFLGYFTVGDGRVRDQHRVWHATVLPVDDP